MIIAVDTNVLIDILNKDKSYFEFSRKLLNEALKRGALIINEIEDITELILKIFPCSLIL